MRVRLPWSRIVLVACTAHVLTLSIDTRQALAAALYELIEALPGDTAAVCLTLPRGTLVYWYAPQPRLLDELRTPRHRVIGPSQCPPTYQVMYPVLDSTGRYVGAVRPVGYIDPHDVVVETYEWHGTDSASVEATASQGTLHRHFACTARRGPHWVWRARCDEQESSMSAAPLGETLQLTSREQWDV